MKIPKYAQRHFTNWRKFILTVTAVLRQKALGFLQKAVEQKDIAAMKKNGEFYRDGDQGFNIDYKKITGIFYQRGGNLFFIF